MRLVVFGPICLFVYIALLVRSMDVRVFIVECNKFLLRHASAAWSCRTDYQSFNENFLII